MIDGPNVKINDLEKNNNNYWPLFWILWRLIPQICYAKSTKKYHGTIFFFFLSSEHGTAVFLDMYVPRYYNLIPSVTVLPRYCFVRIWLLVPQIPWFFWPYSCTMVFIAYATPLRPKQEWCSSHRCTDCPTFLQLLIFCWLVNRLYLY